MPNTLAHIGVQAIATRALLPAAPPGWIWLGAVFPDLAWIAQRGLRALPLELSLYDIRLWAVAQSSLLFCLVGAGAFAAATRRPAQVFAILAFGSALHLLLDALQTKWGNGVVLLAPLDWRALNAGQFWPESPVTLALTALGAAVFIYAAFRWRTRQGPGRQPRRLAAAVLLGLVWLLGPLPLLSAVEASDPHYIATLRDVGGRSGKAIELDRAVLTSGADGRQTLRIWTGESLNAAGLGAESGPGVVSVRGRFLAPDTVEVETLHRHEAGWRDGMSYLGLALVATWWALAAWTSLRGERTHDAASSAVRSDARARRPRWRWSPHRK